MPPHSGYDIIASLNTITPNLEKIQVCVYSRVVLTNLQLQSTVHSAENAIETAH